MSRLGPKGYPEACVIEVPRSIKEEKIWEEKICEQKRREDMRREEKI